MDITDLVIDNGEPNEFDEVLQGIHHTYEDETFKFKKLNVTTITVLTKVATVLCLQKLYDALGSTQVMTYNPNRDDKTGAKRLFYNCLKWEIQVEDNGTRMNVSAKVFPNGKFQFAGFKTIKAIILLPRIIMSMIRKIDGCMTDLDKIIDNPTLIQINSTFYMFKREDTWQIIQHKLNEILLREEHVKQGGRGINSTFRPDKYPGINVKFQCGNAEKKITLLIFATGSVLINGGSHIEDYRDAYNMLCNLIVKYKKEVIIEKLF